MGCDGLWLRWRLTGTSSPDHFPVHTPNTFRGVHYAAYLSPGLGVEKSAVASMDAFGGKIPGTIINIPLLQTAVIAHGAPTQG